MNHGLIRLDSTEHWDALAGAALYLQGPAPPRKNSFHFCHDILTCFRDLFISCSYWNTCLQQTVAVGNRKHWDRLHWTAGLHLHKNSISTTLLQKLTVAQLVKKFCTLMEHPGSLPCSQQPTTCPSPQTNETSRRSPV